jgi:hypothetical protein
MGAEIQEISELYKRQLEFKYGPSKSGKGSMCAAQVGWAKNLHA